MERVARALCTYATLPAFVLGGGAATACAETASQTFTGAGQHAFVVPAGVTSLEVTLIGGNGGAGRSGSAGGAGGQGATVDGTVAVTPGETLYAEVAGNGEPGGSEGAGAGGSGGGGSGGEIFLSKGGGGGGGASDLRTCPLTCSGSSLPTRLLVAGGGGGGGGEGGLTAVSGGPGGSADRSGTDGSRNGTVIGGEGGGRGTASAGGAAGLFSYECPTKATCAKPGAEGGGGPGGDGTEGGAGGGGGGGIFGGGGGGGGEGFEVSFPVFQNGGGGGGGGGASGVLAAGATRVSGFQQLLTALGAQPSISISWTVPVATTNPSPSAASGAPAAGSAPVASVSGLTVSPSRFRRASHVAVLSRAKTPTGTTISFTLSQRAMVTLAFEQALSGVSVGRRCLRPSASHRHGKPCTRWVRVAHTVVREAQAGPDRVNFQGVLDGGSRLSPGRYRLSLSATDAAGSASAAQHPSFTLLP